jgi:hypothetical protein
MILDFDGYRPLPSGINSIGMVILVVLGLRIGGELEDKTEKGGAIIIGELFCFQRVVRS